MGRGVFTQQRKPQESTPAARVEGAEVACVAYTLYEQRGCAHGCDVEDWLKAEAIVRQRAPRKANGR